MPYSYVLTASIPATAEEIYQAWLDSDAHSAMTGGAANMSDQTGTEVSAWDGYITGRNLELVPHERIVQSWRTSEFTDAHEDSVIVVTLRDVVGGTLLTLEHRNVPDDQRSYEEDGWQSNYFEPMMAYFNDRRQAAGASKPSGRSPRQKKRDVAGLKSKRPKKKIVPRARKTKRKPKRKSGTAQVRRSKRRRRA